METYFPDLTMKGKEHRGSYEKSNYEEGVIAVGALTINPFQVSAKRESASLQMPSRLERVAVLSV